MHFLGRHGAISTLMGCDKLNCVSLFDLVCGCVHEAELVFTRIEMMKKNDTLAVLEKQRLSCEVFSRTVWILSLIV